MVEGISMKVSVIISTHNRPDMLRGSLRSLLQQTLGLSEYEVIVADSYSSGQGLENQRVVDALSKEFPSANIRYFYEPVQGGWTLTRTKAVEAASCEYILVGDDDFVASPTFVESGLKALECENVGIVEGRMLPLYEEKPPIWIENLWNKNECGDILTDFTLLDFGEDEKEIPPEYAMGSNFGFRKKVLLECGGFAPDGFGNDLVLYNGTGEIWFAQNVAKQGYRIVYVPGMSAQHFVAAYRFKDDFFKARHYYYGITMSFYSIRKHKKVDGKTLKNAKNARRWLGRCKRMVFGKKNLSDKWQQAFWQGYNDHQQAVRKSPEMLDYVCRKNWLDFDFSTLKPLNLESKSLW